MTKRTPFISRRPRPFSARHPLRGVGNDMEDWKKTTKTTRQRRVSAGCAFGSPQAPRLFPPLFAFFLFFSLFFFFCGGPPPQPPGVGVVGGRGDTSRA